MVNSSKKKIAIFNWRNPWDPKAGGAEKVTLKHAEFWVKQGYQVTWISGSYPGSKTSYKKLGINFFNWGPSKFFFIYAGFIYWLVFKGDFDVVVDEAHGFPVFSSLWAWKSKKVVLIHEVAQEIWQEMFPAPISTIGKFAEKYIFKWLYFGMPFWVDCLSAKEDLIDLGVSKDRVTVISCAIDTPPKITAQKNKNLTLIFLARLVKMKGIEYALDVFSKVLAKEPKAQLWIVGTGEEDYVKSLKEKASEMGVSGGIKFWGLVNEKKKFELLKKAHFLVHTSIREGFGLTVLEANSQKTPAVVFRVAALKDIVESGKSGLIVPFAKTKIMSDKIVSFWKDKKTYTKMSQTAYKYYQQYQWSKFTRQGLDLIKSL